MTIQAKMRCSSVAHKHDGANKSEFVELAAVTGKENEPWSKWTPSGSLNLHITNPAAQGHFEPGKVYIISIEEEQA